MRAQITCLAKRKPIPVSLFQPQTPHFFVQQPDIPVFPATRLQLDLLLSQPSLDVDAILAVLLGDVGACLQVWRAAAKGQHHRPGPSPFEGCIFHLGRLGLRTVTRAVLSASVGSDLVGARALWLRSRLRAERAASVAVRSSRENLIQAPMAALLSEAGRIPALLGWRVPGLDLRDCGLVISAMVHEWGVPALVSITDYEARRGINWPKRYSRSGLLHCGLFPSF